MDFTSTRPKFFVFVLMPFRSEFNDIYELGIKAACEEVGAYAERVDEQIFNTNILERVYNQISRADLIIADMTGQNPNVFYECGYAHALGKTVVLLTENPNDIPFDLKHFQHIIYEGKIVVLKRELSKHVLWYKENPGNVPVRADILDIFIEQTRLDISSSPTIIMKNFISNRFFLKIDFYNSGEKYLKIHEFRLSVSMPEVIRVQEWDQNSFVDTFNSGDDEITYSLNKDYRLRPGERGSARLICMVGSLDSDFSAQVKLRVISDTDFIDYPFTLKVSEVMIPAL